MKISSTISLGAPLRAATLLRGDIFDCIARSVDMGFDGVELQLNLDEGSAIDFGEVAEFCGKKGIAVSAYATGSLYVKNGLSLIDDDPAVVDKAISRLKLYVDAAEITGGKVIIGCVRGNIPDPGEYLKLEERFASSMGRVLDAAGQKGVGVVLEAINRYENNYLATASQTACFIEKYNLPLEILLDTFHMNIEERDMAAAFSAAAGHLGHVHLADNTREVPGMGSLDFSKIIGCLRGIGYDGWLSFECFIDKDEDEEAKLGLRHVKKLMD